MEGGVVAKTHSKHSLAALVPLEPRIKLRGPYFNEFCN